MFFKNNVTAEHHFLIFSAFFSISDLDSSLGSSYSLFRLVWPNTEEPFSRPFLGLSKIRLVLQDNMSPKNVRKNLALFQLLLNLQLQQNTMVFIDVDGQICHFCSQGFVL